MLMKVSAAAKPEVNQEPQPLETKPVETPPAHAPPSSQTPSIPENNSLIVLSAPQSSPVNNQQPQIQATQSVGAAPGGDHAASFHSAQL